MKENRKNVLMVTCSFPPEPIVASKINKEIADALSKEFNVTVLCPPATRPYGTIFSARKAEENAPYRIVELEGFSHPIPSVSGRLRESWCFGKNVSLYLHSHRDEIDAIYAFPWPIFAQYILLKEAKNLGIPTITHIQDLYPESILGKMGLPGRLVRPLLVAIDRHQMRRATKYIAISPQMRSKLVKTRRLHHEDVVMARNWQDFDLYSNTESVFPNRFTMMFVGSLSPSANIPLLIKSFVKADIPGSRLVIGGTGSQKEICVSLAAQYPDAEIEFVDITPETTPMLQSGASVMLLSLKKNVAMTATPSKLIAYMFSGKPVIGSLDLGSDADMILQDSGGGEVVEADNVDKFAMLMRKYSKKSISELQRIGENARKYALVNFCREQNLAKIVRAIKDLME